MKLGTALVIENLWQRLGIGKALQSLLDKAKYSVAYDQALLAMTREGLPVKIWVFPGNTADVSTVGPIRKDLRGWNLGRALFVAARA